MRGFVNSLICLNVKAIKRLNKSTHTPINKNQE